MSADAGTALAIATTSESGQHECGGRDPAHPADGLHPLNTAEEREAYVFYESTKMRADLYQERYEAALKCVFALRRRLRALDPSLPDEYDGTAWWPIESDSPSEPPGKL